jgi:hypothetical protein
MTRPALILVAALAACAAPNVDRSAADFDATTFAVDLNLCRGGNFTEASLKTIGKGALGSLAGAGVMVLHGAAAANSGEAIVVGAAIGAVIGLGVGAHDAVEEHELEIADCLVRKATKWWMVAPVSISARLSKKSPVM